MSPPTSQASLLALPNELLLQIFSHCVPEYLRSEGERDHWVNADEHTLFRDSTLVSKRYHLVAKEAFFDSYIHQVRIICDHRRRTDAIRRRDVTLARDNVRNLGLSILAPNLADLELVAANLLGDTEDFANVRVLYVDVETKVDERRVAGILERIWGIVNAWAERRQVENGQGRSKLFFNWD
ncbi:hypothetical protein B0A55_05808 [Friedmanniomyces simplex]|uniref:F-box domain-containing protein n=1 Tax=Friedmanniomyces simplex TaxID=329884 RepID=A0A4U0XQT3_9PEZI|nr:hypothetical protein B0A55_05808 [Friedmanniomyces simplex]